MSPFDRLESDFRAQFAAMATPIAPAGVVDVTPETEADPDTVAAVRAHLDTWKRNRKEVA